MPRGDSDKGGWECPGVCDNGVAVPREGGRALGTVMGGQVPWGQ